MVRPIRKGLYPRAQSTQTVSETPMLIFFCYQNIIQDMTARLHAYILSLQKVYLLIYLALCINKPHQ